MKMETPPNFLFHGINEVFVLGPSKEKLRALPLQLIEIDEGVLVKRGFTVLKVQGEGAALAVQTVLSTLGRNPSTREEISNLFSAPEREAVSQLLDMLMSKRLVVSSHSQTNSLGRSDQESPLEIFYWNFGQSAHNAVEQFNNHQVTILGVNTISLRLLSSLTNSGFRNAEIVDHPQFRNLRLFDSNGTLSIKGFSYPHEISPRNYQDWLEHTDPQSIGCLVATSDFGGRLSFQEWNQFCVKNQLHFLPVSLRDEIGFVGPLVIPGETACFECLIARKNSHMPNRLHAKAIDDHASSGQDVIGFHPSMTSILGDIAAMELNKFYSGRIPGWKVGTLIEVNLLTSRMIPRKVLKIPRCPICSTLTTTPSTNVQKDFFNSPKS